MGLKPEGCCICSLMVKTQIFYCCGIIFRSGVVWWFYPPVADSLFFALELRIASYICYVIKNV